jgi:hypothetical protein
MTYKEYKNIMLSLVTYTTVTLMCYPEKNVGLKFLPFL